MNKRIANKIMADFDRWYLSGGACTSRNYNRRQFEAARKRLDSMGVVFTVMFAMDTP